MSGVSPGATCLGRWHMGGGAPIAASGSWDPPPPGLYNKTLAHMTTAAGELSSKTPKVGTW